MYMSDDDEFNFSLLIDHQNTDLYPKKVEHKPENISIAVFVNQNFNYLQSRLFEQVSSFKIPNGQHLGMYEFVHEKGNLNQSQKKKRRAYETKTGG